VSGTAGATAGWWPRGELQGGPKPFARREAAMPSIRARMRVFCWYRVARCASTRVLRALTWARPQEGGERGG
jgi:hypothetical protein